MKGFCVFILLLINYFNLVAQTRIVNVDSIYNNANTYFLEKHYLNAIEQERFRNFIYCLSGTTRKP